MKRVGNNNRSGDDGDGVRQGGEGERREVDREINRHVREGICVCDSGTRGYRVGDMRLT